jgi:predicted nucleotidyltransferase
MQETQLNSEIRKAADVLKSLGASEVFLFGSAASKRFNAGKSDIDLAVTGLPASMFIRALCKAHEVTEHKLDLVDLDDDNAFTRYLKQDGEMIRVG